MIKIYLLFILFVSGCTMGKMNNGLTDVNSGYIGDAEKWNNYFECISTEFGKSYDKYF